MDLLYSLTLGLSDRASCCLLFMRLSEYVCLWCCQADRGDSPSPTRDQIILIELSGSPVCTHECVQLQIMSTCGVP